MAWSRTSSRRTKNRDMDLYRCGDRVIVMLCHVICPGSIHVIVM